MARRQFSGTRKNRQWFGSSQTNGVALVLTSAAGVVKSFLGLTSQPTGLEETLTVARLRGSLLVTFDPVAIGDDVMVGVGLGIFNSNAVAAGVASVPDPIQRPDYPWIWMTYVPLIGSGTSKGLRLGAQVHREVIDNKAMRKLRPGESLEFVAAVEAVGAVGTVDISLASRILVLV